MAKRAAVRTKNLFEATSSHHESAIVVMFDLQGFSKFFSQPDVHEYVAKYLNHVLAAMNVVLNGGDPWFMEMDEEEKSNGRKPWPELPVPLHKKFLGDGMLYIWRYSDFTPNQRVGLINKLWSLKICFSNVVKRCSSDISLTEMPQDIRFGVASGTVHRLQYVGSRNPEYIGFCINLASRLMDYCKDIGFVVSARMNIPDQKLEDHKWIKVEAIDIKGMPNQIVIVDSEEYAELSAERKKELFKVDA